MRHISRLTILSILMLLLGCALRQGFERKTGIDSAHQDLVDLGELESFWSKSPRHGANFFNQKETRDRFVAARRLGLSWVRLTPSKWSSKSPNARPGDFLIGPKGNYQGLIKKDLEHLLKVLDIAQEEGIKVVLTFLNVPGRRWSQQNQGAQEEKIWQDFETQEIAIQFFSDLANHLKHEALAGINPINEPSPEKTGIPFEDWYQGDYLRWYQKIIGSSQDLNLFYRKLVAAIRKSSSTLPIILDYGYFATPWSLKVAEPIDDPHVLYAIHFYEPFSYSFQKGEYSYPGILPTGEVLAHQKSEFWDLNKIRDFFKPVREWQVKNNILDSKIIVSEFGVFRDAPGAKEYLKDALQVFEENGWHWAFYSFREDNFARMDLELGASKKAPYPYWDFIEAGIMPNYEAMKDKSLIEVIKRALHQRLISPPMGWNSWNWFGKKIDESLIQETILAMSNNGFREAGYEYIVIDGGWRGEALGKGGEIVVDSKKFPSGIKQLVDLAHEKGLKFGVHIVAGTHDCGGNPTGSKGHEIEHVNQLITWGIDFIKLDKCLLKGTEDWPREVLQSTYAKWHRILKTSTRPIFLSLSTYEYNDWNKKIGQTARTTIDIKPKIFGGAVFDSDFTGDFLSVMDIAEKNDGFASKAGHGYWNDPDLLVIGDEHLSIEEQKSHFALWSIMTAPLFISTDIRNLRPDIKAILCNKEAILVNQDPLEQGRRLKRDGLSEIWVKHLSDGSKAVLLLNRNKTDATITLHAKDMGILKKFSVFDIYEIKPLGVHADFYSITLKPKSSLFIKVVQRD